VKNLNLKVNLPLFLFIVNFIHTSYLLHVGHAVTMPSVLFSFFLIMMYGFNIYMDHVKKPDAHKLLEDTWKSELSGQTAPLRKEVQELKSRLTAFGMTLSVKPAVNGKDVAKSLGF